MGCKVGQPTLVIYGVISPTTGVITLLTTGTVGVHFLVTQMLFLRYTSPEKSSTEHLADESIICKPFLKVMHRNNTPKKGAFIPNPVKSTQKFPPSNNLREPQHTPRTLSIPFHPQKFQEFRIINCWLAVWGLF